MDWCSSNKAGCGIQPISRACSSILQAHYHHLGTNKLTLTEPVTPQVEFDGTGTTQVSELVLFMDDEKDEEHSCTPSTTTDRERLLAVAESALTRIPAPYELVPLALPLIHFPSNIPPVSWPLVFGLTGPELACAHVVSRVAGAAFQASSTLAAAAPLQQASNAVINKWVGYRERPLSGYSSARQRRLCRNHDHRGRFRSAAYLARHY